jgi:hypothetical protein
MNLKQMGQFTEDYKNSNIITHYSGYILSLNINTLRKYTVISYGYYNGLILKINSQSFMMATCNYYYITSGSKSSFD